MTNLLIEKSWLETDNHILCLSGSRGHCGGLWWSGWSFFICHSMGNWTNKTFGPVTNSFGSLCWFQKDPFTSGARVWVFSQTFTVWDALLEYNLSGQAIIVVTRNMISYNQWSNPALFALFLCHKWNLKFHNASSHFTQTKVVCKWTKIIFNISYVLNVHGTSYAKWFIIHKCKRISETPTCRLFKLCPYQTVLFITPYNVPSYVVTTAQTIRLAKYAIP